MSHHSEMTSPAAILRAAMPRWTASAWNFKVRPDSRLRRSGIQEYRLRAWSAPAAVGEMVTDTPTVGALREWREHVLSSAGLDDLRTKGFFVPVLRFPGARTTTSAPAPLREALLRHPDVLEEASRLGFGGWLLLRMKFRIPLWRWTAPKIDSFEMEGDIADHLLGDHPFEAAVKRVTAAWLRASQPAFAGCSRGELAVAIQGLSGHEIMRYKRLSQA